MTSIKDHVNYFLLPGVFDPRIILKSSTLESINQICQKFLVDNKEMQSEAIAVGFIVRRKDQNGIAYTTVKLSSGFTKDDLTPDCISILNDIENSKEYFAALKNTNEQKDLVPIIIDSLERYGNNNSDNDIDDNISKAIHKFCSKEERDRSFINIKNPKELTNNSFKPLWNGDISSHCVKPITVECGDQRENNLILGVCAFDLRDKLKPEIEENLHILLNVIEDLLRNTYYAYYSIFQNSTHIHEKIDPYITFPIQTDGKLLSNYFWLDIIRRELNISDGFVGSGRLAAVMFCDGNNIKEFNSINYPYSYLFGSHAIKLL